MKSLVSSTVLNWLNLFSPTRFRISQNLAVRRLTIYFSAACCSAGGTTPRILLLYSKSYLSRKSAVLRNSFSVRGPVRSVAGQVTNLPAISSG